MSATFESDYLIIGAGFSGLTLGFRLAQAGKTVIVIEGDSQVGGLAADFQLGNGSKLERFYHHWFNSDTAISGLVHDLGLSREVKEYPSRTGMYFNKAIWNLSAPLDLLRFKPLRFHNRLRLGVATLLVRLVKDYKKIESKSIREWLEPIFGKEVYKVVWEPLVNAKFSIYSEEVSAAWMWKKLVLRGSTRRKNGSESLLYIDGGFGLLAEKIAESIVQQGGQVICNERVKKILTNQIKISKVMTENGNSYLAREVIFTGAPSQLTEIMDLGEFQDWEKKLNSIQYLGNICLVLLLDRSLSDTYWLNVNDPGFPFVGVIEHTNLVSDAMYKDLHVVYLSRYIHPEHMDYRLPNHEYLEQSVNSLRKMFPNFEVKWIKESYVWRTKFAQPITDKNYSRKLPSIETPFSNLYLHSMAQVYPEDRGTNYAVQQSEILAKRLLIVESTNLGGAMI